MLNPSSYPQIYVGIWSNNWDQETRIKARGLLLNLESSETIIAFIVAKNVLENIRPIASKLQKRDLDIYHAYNMIDETKKRIETLRFEIEAEFNVWYEEATHLFRKLGITIQSPRIIGSGRQIHRANAPSTCPKEYYLRNLAIPFVDHLLVELDNRFKKSSRQGVEILALLPGSIALQGVDIQPVVDNLLFWEADLPFSSSLRFEVKEWQRYWRSKEPIPSSINLSECISHADEDTFPNIFTLLKIGCTLPVGSCEAERSFSCLRKVKTYLRSTIGQERLSGLTLMNMNHSMEISLERICQMFIGRHKRRMFSSSILYD